MSGSVAVYGSVANAETIGMKGMIALINLLRYYRARKMRWAVRLLRQERARGMSVGIGRLAGERVIVCQYMITDHLPTFSKQALILSDDA